MNQKVKICICGGGSLGHVCAGVLSANSDVELNVYTQHPEKWIHNIIVADCNGHIFAGNINIISNDPSQAISGCDIVFLCLPGFAIESILQTIKPYLADNAIVGAIVSSTGFFFAAHKLLGKDVKLFGFQRTPFIARTNEYGHSANLLGYKSTVAIAAENIVDKESFRRLVERLWMTPTVLLNNFYEAALTNSNPILHTGRLYSMFKDWHGEIFDHNILFYEEWTDDASQTIIDMDIEFQQLLKRLPVTPGAIPTLLDYYESSDASSLTNKIKSIKAFKNITSPMKKVEGGWVPNFESRYFTEDFPYGLKYIAELINNNEIPSCTIKKVYEWGMFVNTHYNS